MLDLLLLNILLMLVQVGLSKILEDQNVTS